jgi:hypothetical protein
MRDDNPLVALLDDGDGLPEFHSLLDAVFEWADTILSSLITWVTDSMVVAQIVAKEVSAGLVWGEPCWA